MVQFRSQGQQFCFCDDLARMFGVESDASEAVPNAEAHTCPPTSLRSGDYRGGRCQGEVIACELLARETIAGYRLM